MSTLLRDARFGVRLLRRSPGFTAVAVAALALGIAANTAIFSVIYTTFFEPLPYRDAGRLVMVWSQYQGDRNENSAGDFVEWQRRATAFDDLQAWSASSVNIATADRPERLQAGYATPGFLPMLGYGHPLALGRDFLPDEGIVGRDRVVILTHSVWTERFGGDPQIIGRQVRIDGEPRTVVGVLAPGAADRQQNRLWLPLAFTPAMLNHDARWLLVMGRLRPGVTTAQANTDMTGVSRALAAESPSSNRGWSTRVEPFRNNFLSERTKTSLWLLLAAVAFVLLIACVNVANLLLARGSARQRELAVRSALGASRLALIRQLVVESLVLAAVGGALGVALASALVRAIVTLMPAYTLPSEAAIRLNIPVLLFTVVACVTSGVFFGGIPAWQNSRMDIIESLKQAARVGGGAGNVLRRGLVVVEFALALSLLAGGGLAVHSLLAMTRSDLGFRPDHLLTFTLPMRAERANTPESISGFYTQLSDRIGALPDVVSTSISSNMPVEGLWFWNTTFEVVGAPPVSPEGRPQVVLNMVSSSYFRTFGISLARGRPFTDQDRAGAAPVAIVNGEFVRRYLRGLDPLTQRLIVSEPQPAGGGRDVSVERQIVGVYDRVRNAGPAHDSFPEIDVPFAQRPLPQVKVAVRTAGDPQRGSRDIAAIVHAMDPDLPVADVKTMDQVVSESYASERFNTILFGSFAAVALVLAGIGVYGVLSFSVAQRTSEIGIRLALGAGRSRVLRDVLREGMSAALAGSVLGLAGAYFVSRTLQRVVFGVSAVDPGALVAVTAVLLGAAFLACVIPALRAASVDPMVALRRD
jgi:putative ABC transport system permease protein